MNLVWSTVIAIHLVSFMFMAVCLLRTFSFQKRNLFIESKYTLLFGAVKIEHVVYAYIFFTTLFAIGSFAVIYYLSIL